MFDYLSHGENVKEHLKMLHIQTKEETYNPCCSFVHIKPTYCYMCVLQDKNINIRLYNDSSGSFVPAYSLETRPTDFISSTQIYSLKKFLYESSSSHPCKNIK